MPRHAIDQASDERRNEIAKLLAAGLLRFHRRVRVATPPPPNPTGIALMCRRKRA